MLDFLSEHPLRLPRLTPYEAPAGAPRIFHFNAERDDIVHTVVSRVYGAHSREVDKLEITLNDAAFHEVRRLESQHDHESEEALPGWRMLVRGIARMSDDEKRHALQAIVENMSRDVAGNFDPRVYDFARRGVPKLLTAVMRPSRLPGELLRIGSSVADEALTVQGNVEHLRALEKRGTMVYVPTHSS
ncbi:MAG: hypothetical protein H5U40_07835, partial [Polyangiaceae bacterium]|nr:hypothetical protein [Polyangiaceae bacterium]